MSTAEARIGIAAGLFYRSNGASDGAADIWLIHGFAESSFCYRYVIDAARLAGYRLHAVDLPGFGVSPARPDCATIAGLAGAIARAIAERSAGRPVILVGHSLGAPIAVDATGDLDGLARGLVSVEGNLTAADTFFSGQAIHYIDPGAFKADFSAQIEAYKRLHAAYAGYATSVALADAETMWRLGRDVVARSENDALGAAYRALSFPRLYYWGKAATTDQAEAYLSAHGLANQRFEAASHWPMIDIPEAFAEMLDSFVRGVV
ncbi:MAG: alpha/beta fold hydrolase [Alphaproteobacteria bacterium]|nr:alpha/beta fold hydrolase [Alphaproteobacteria bacterium]